MRTREETPKAENSYGPKFGSSKAQESRGSESSRERTIVVTFPKGSSPPLGHSASIHAHTDARGSPFRFVPSNLQKREVSLERVTVKYLPLS